MTADIPAQPAGQEYDFVEFAKPYPTSMYEHDGGCGCSCEADWICTRTRGHHGRHEAALGDAEVGAVIVAAWATVPTGESIRAVCSGGGPSRTPGKVLIEFQVDEGTERQIGSEWLLTRLGGEFDG